MNEENFHEETPTPTPEEEQPQGEKKEGGSMKKLIYALLAVAVLALVVVACAPMVMDQAPVSQPEDVWTEGGVLESHGLTIRWTYDSSHDGIIPQVRNRDLDSATFEAVYGNKSFDASPLQVSWFVGMVFFFYDHLESGNDPARIYEDELDNFATLFAQTYLSECGEIYEPLSWGGHRDGQCALPNPIDLGLDHLPDLET